MSVDNHPASPQEAGTSPRGADSFDDMHDTPQELGCFPLLAVPLGLCEKIAKEFDTSDGEAIDYQRIHRGLTRGAALLGTFAVLSAIAGLGRGNKDIPLLIWLPGKEVLDWLELFFAGVALIVVVVGWLFQFKEKWLLHRHRAESYRLLRYRFLIHPSVWRSSAEEARSWLDSHMNEISQTTLEKAVQESSPHGPFEGTQSKLPRETLRALTEYYLSRRLNPQKEYLANRTQSNEFSDWIRAYLPWFFFLSIVAVFCKFFVGHSSLRWAGSLALLAALLPAAAAGIRTWRSAFEFSRNKGRFAAAHHALRDLERRLVNEGFAAVETEGATGAGPRRITVHEEQVLTRTQFRQVSLRTEEQEPEASATDPAHEIDAYQILRDLSWCEHILETEHREWLRLMYETEWFG